MIDVLGSKNPMTEIKFDPRLDWSYKNNSVILIKLRFKIYGWPFDLFFPGSTDLVKKNSQDQGIRTMIDGSDPKYS